MELQSTNTVRVKCVQKFVEVVCRCRDEWIEGAAYFDLCFRGQTHVSWALAPNILRYEMLGSEDEIRAEFQRRAPQYMTELAPVDYWGWYILMQHFGAPTRLLDWTDSALVALFFALNPASRDVEDEEDAVVWILDPWWLNKTVLGNESILLPNFHGTKGYLAEPYESIDGAGLTHIRPQYPVAVDPPYIARRVAVQRSHFTIFGNDREGLTRLGEKPGARLKKIVIAKEKKARMRADLLLLGITDTSIYPDLRGLSDELTRYQEGSWPPD